MFELLGACWSSEKLYAAAEDENNNDNSHKAAAHCGKYGVELS